MEGRQHQPHDHFLSGQEKHSQSLSGAFLIPVAQSFVDARGVLQSVDGKYNERGENNWYDLDFYPATN